jgi:hypothetical protein
VREAGNFSPKAKLPAANLLRCRLFAEFRDSRARDCRGWLGCQDSNLGMAEWGWRGRLGEPRLRNAQLTAQWSCQNSRLVKKCAKLNKSRFV